MNWSFLSFLHLPFSWRTSCWSATFFLSSSLSNTHSRTWRFFFIYSGVFLSYRSLCCFVLGFFFAFTVKRYFFSIFTVSNSRFSLYLLFFCSFSVVVSSTLVLDFLSLFYLCQPRFFVSSFSFFSYKKLDGIGLEFLSRCFFFLLLFFGFLFL